MEHCIGGSHVMNARKLGAFHYSLRRIDDGKVRHVVTFSLTPTGTMSFINGHKNSKIIPETAIMATQSYIADVATPAFKDATQTIASHNANKAEKAIQTGIHPWSIICNYDWQEKGSFGPHLDSWKPLFPKQLKIETVDDLFSCAPIIGIAKALDPACRSELLRKATQGHIKSLFACSHDPYGAPSPNQSRAPAETTPRKPQFTPSR